MIDVKYGLNKFGEYEFRLFADAPCDKDELYRCSDEHEDKVKGLAVGMLQELREEAECAIDRIKYPDVDFDVRCIEDGSGGYDVMCDGVQTFHLSSGYQCPEYCVGWTVEENGKIKVHPLGAGMSAVELKAKWQFARDLMVVKIKQEYL